MHVRLAHFRTRVAAGDAEGRKKLAGTTLRAPRCLAKMSYDAASGTVIYRSRTTQRTKAVWARQIRKVYEAGAIAVSRGVAEDSRSKRLIARLVPGGSPVRTSADR